VNIPNEPRTRHRRDVRGVVRGWWRSWEWPAVGVLALIGLALGYLGLLRFYADAPAWQRHPWEILYATTQLLSVQFGGYDRPLHWTLQVARLLLPAIAGYAAVKGLAALYFEQLQTLRVRLFVRNHTIICGLGQKGLLLARGLRARGEPVVVIENDAENDLIRSARDAGSSVLLGDATEPYMLRRAGISRARHVVAVCRDDGLNAEIAIRTRELAELSGNSLHCVCHIFDSRLWTLLKEHQAEAVKGNFSLEFRNVYAEGATELLKNDPRFPDLTSGPVPHALIVGVGRMGESLAVELAGRWQVVRREDARRMRITLVDRHAEAKRDFLMSEYPQLADAWELCPVQLEVDSPEFQTGRFLSGTRQDIDIQRAYVCLDSDSLALSAALRIERQLRMYNRRIAIVLRTRQYGGLAVLLRHIDDPECPQDCVKVFGLLDHTCKPELWLDENVA